MKFFNCKNRKGFDIDGKMDPNELNFNNEFCPWQMVTGPSGTFLKSFDFEQNFATEVEKDKVFKNWYYDNGNPSTKSPDGVPVFIDPYFNDKFQNASNGFHLCSALQDNQVFYNRY